MASIITMPRLSPTMEEGVLAKWTKKEGDKIMPGDVIAEVETDKANMDFPLEDEGVLLKFLVAAGDTVKLGAPVAVLGEVGESLETALKQLGDGVNNLTTLAPATAAKPSGGSPTPTPTVQSENGAVVGRAVKASPFARKLARERGLDLKQVAGSGLHGRIVARDVMTTPASGKTFVARADELVAPSQMRKTIARRLVEAKREIPHIYLTADATMDALFELREQLLELSGTKVSVNDLVVKAFALAIRRIEESNVSWTEQGILHRGSVDIGIAVSLPDGLITPVVRAADQKSLGALSTEIKALAERARIKKLKPEEYSGGSATVSNLGMYNVREFVAIINPPEAMILAVGTTEKRPIVVDTNGHSEIRIARQMTLTLSCDHRVIDGVLGARVLGELVKLLEKPIALVL